MVVLWSAYYGAAIFGDGQKIACSPHNGCWLEIVGTAGTSHRKVNRLLPGQVIRSTRSFLLEDRFDLPGGPRVGLGNLVGFRLQVVQYPMGPIPAEEDLVERKARDLVKSVTV